MKDKSKYVLLVRWNDSNYPYHIIYAKTASVVCKCRLKADAENILAFLNSID
jgi:hypothetical protein